MSSINDVKIFPIEEWDTLPTEVYEKVLSEVKENFNEYASEVTSITDKSIKLLTLVVSFTAGAGLYIVSKKGIPVVNCMLAVGAILVIIKIYNVFKGHEIHYAGNQPAQILTKDFDNPDFEKEDKQKLIYKNIIEQYCYKINEMTEINKDRVGAYDECIIYSIALIITISFYIGFI